MDLFSHLSPVICCYVAFCLHCFERATTEVCSLPLDSIPTEPRFWRATLDNKWIRLSHWSARDVTSWLGDGIFENYKKIINYYVIILLFFFVLFVQQKISYCCENIRFSFPGFWMSLKLRAPYTSLEPSRALHRVSTQPGPRREDLKSAAGK